MTEINYFYLIIPLLLFLAGYIPLKIYNQKKYATWKLMFFGGLVWGISVALKSVFAYFFNEPINIFLVSIWIPLYYIYVGLLTGIFEIFIPLFFIKKYKHKLKEINDKIGFGLGFGSIEAMFIGILTLISFIVVNIFSSSVPIEAVQSFTGSNSELLLRGIFGGIERLSATMVHTFCIFMIFLFVSSKKLKHILIPIFLKTLTDGLSLYFIVSKTPTIIFESIYLGIGLWAIFSMFKIMKSEKMELKPKNNFKTKRAKNNKLIKTLTTRLFVALIVLSVVGWIILFGKNLPSSFTPVVYAIIGITIIGSVYVFWKKPQLLQNKKIMVGLIIFIIIGAIGWITSISEITGCRPYKCIDDLTCAKPTELGLKITTGKCTSEFSESINFSCVKENNVCIKKLIKP